MLMGMAYLKSCDFQDGIIEVDIAVKHARTYPGIIFRMQSESDCERFYIRPHRAPFYPDALQYTPVFNKLTGWQLYSGEGCTAGAVIPADTWNHLKVEVKGAQARVFWNDMEKPALVIHDLKHGASRGTLGVMGPTDGTAYFSKFRYTVTDDLDFPPLAPVETPEGTITDWEISRMIPAGNIDIELIPYPRFYTIFGAQWEKVTPEVSGLVNVSRYREWTGQAPECILARTIVWSDGRQDVRLQFGYSDEITIFLNGRKLFYGMSAYRWRDPTFLGIVKYSDTVFLPLEKGRNEIFFVVKENSHGWGFMARTDRVLQPPTRDHGRLSRVWETEKVFLTPESVLCDPKRDVLYVTNFDNRANMQETDPTKFTGYISKLSLAGDILEKEWVSGLHCPAGIAIHKNKLYTAERRNLTEIDLKSGKIAKRHPIPGCDFPNDVAVAADGAVYISDTSPSDFLASKIYKFENGKFEVWKQGEEVFRPNGMYVYDDKLLFGGNPGDGAFKSADLGTGRVERITCLGAGVIDGIRPDGEGNYLVSHWEGFVYHITNDGKVTELMNVIGEFNTADFEYIVDKNLLIVPTFVDNRVMAFRLSPSSE